MFAILKWLLLLGLALVLAGFSVVNRDQVSIAFYPLPYALELPLYLLIVLVFVAGFLSAWLMGRLRALKQGHQLRKTARRNEALSEEITRLKHQPAPTEGK